MVCNLVTYRARSAVREVGYALGFPRPLVDRVAKALETYDSVMVRRDLEADGGFAEFFRRPGEGLPAEAGAAEAAEALGFVDGMGQLNTRVPLVGKVPPWRQPPKPEDPTRREPFAWLRRPRGWRPGERPAPPRDVGRGPESPPSIRPGGRHDDEGGPGDTPASVAWLRAGRGTGYDADARPARRPGADRRPAGRPGERPAGAAAARRRTSWAGRPTGIRRRAGRSVARIEPEPPPQARGGSTVGMSDWERWLEFCARIDGFPRHLSIHSGGMLVTAAPLIDIAPIERATMVDRVVVQFDKRDVETLKLIKLDLLGLGMLAAMDETLQLIEHDCAVCLDLDRLPEDVPEVFEMLQAADTVGVFQVESRAQMQTLPKSRPKSLDDLVVEVAIIRPGPIQGNAVHPFLRRKQGLEPVTYLHPSLEPVLRDSMGVILYQEQVMRIAIEVAGFTPAESDGFRRAMGTWRSSREMEKLHRQFLDGCLRQPGMTEEIAEELFRQVAAFASFGFAKSHAAAFARTAYESSFLKLFYPAQFLVGLINAQPMGFYPVEVLVNDTKRHGVAVLPVDINASTYKTTTEWVGRPGEPLPPGAGITARPEPIRSPACVVPSAAARDRWTAGGDRGLGRPARPRPRQGDRRAARGAARHGAGARAVHEPGRRRRADRAARGGAGAAHPDRGAGFARTAAARAPVAAPRGGRRVTRPGGRADVRGLGRAAGKRGAAAGRPMDLRLPATEAPALPAITESERLGDAYAVIGLDARRQVVTLFRPALERLGAVTNAALSERRPGRVRIGGLVVTRQHPMTAKGTVFLALEDETGMVNVTLWPDTWARLRSVVRRHALLLVDGDLQREGEVVNMIARTSGTPRSGRRGRRAGSAGGRPPTRPRRHAPAGLSGGHFGVAPDGAGVRWRLRSSLTHLGVRSLRCSAPPSPAPSGATISVQRLALAFCEDPVLVRPSPGFAFAACDWRLPRFGLDSARKRRYQAAPDAKNAPKKAE